MAARGGSIDQLMSNLGRHYAGGGIIAFNGEDESKVEDIEQIPPKSKQMRQINVILHWTSGNYLQRRQ